MDHNSLIDDFEQLDDSIKRVSLFIDKLADPLPLWQPAALHRDLLTHVNSGVHKVPQRAFQIIQDGNETIERQVKEVKSAAKADETVAASRNISIDELCQIMQQCSMQQMQSNETQRKLEAEISHLKHVIERTNEGGISDAAKRQLNNQAEQLMQSEDRNANLEAQAAGYRRVIEDQENDAKIAELQRSVHQRDARNADLAAKLDAAEAQNMALKASLETVLRLVYEK